MIGSPMVPCPLCKFPIDGTLIGTEPMHCPRCREVVEPDPRFGVPVIIFSIPLAGALAYLLGTSGFTLVLVAFLLYYPVVFVLWFLCGLFFLRLVKSRSPYDEIVLHVTPKPEATKNTSSVDSRR
jgi:hypothetical protein